MKRVPCIVAKYSQIVLSTSPMTRHAIRKQGIPRMKPHPEQDTYKIIMNIRSCSFFCRRVGRVKGAVVLRFLTKDIICFYYDIKMRPPLYVVFIILLGTLV